MAITPDEVIRTKIATLPASLRSAIDRAIVLKYNVRTRSAVVPIEQLQVLAPDVGNELWYNRDWPFIVIESYTNAGWSVTFDQTNQSLFTFKG